MRSCAAAMTLAFGLAVIGMASAQEPSTLLPRVFGPTTPKKDADKLTDKTDVPKAAPSVNRTADRGAKKAKADLNRRTEVCLKLRGIALESGDEDLLRKVEKLEERVLELYIASRSVMAEPERPAAEPDAKKGSRK